MSFASNFGTHWKMTKRRQLASEVLEVFLILLRRNGVSNRVVGSSMLETRSNEMISTGFKIPHGAYID